MISRRTSCTAARSAARAKRCAWRAVAAFVVGAVAIAIAILLGPKANVAFLVALAFAVAASANLPVIVLSLFWRRFNTAGAVAVLAPGSSSSLLLIFDQPEHHGRDRAIFPLENPGIVSIPLGFLGAVSARCSRASRQPKASSRTDRAREYRPRGRTRSFALVLAAPCTQGQWHQRNTECPSDSARRRPGVSDSATRDRPCERR